MEDIERKYTPIEYIYKATIFGDIHKLEAIKISKSYVWLASGSKQKLTCGTHCYRLNYEEAKQWKKKALIDKAVEKHREWTAIDNQIKKLR